MQLIFTGVTKKHTKVLLQMRYQKERAIFARFPLQSGSLEGTRARIQYHQRFSGCNEKNGVLSLHPQGKLKSELGNKLGFVRTGYSDISFMF